MSHAFYVRPTRRVELIVRDLNNLPQLFAMTLSAARRVAFCDTGAFRHWAIQIEERRYELNIAGGLVVWASSEISAPETSHWTICAIGSTDRFDEELHHCGE